MPRGKCDGRFNFVIKESPDYRPNYGKTYTERQLNILAGTIPLEDVRINELAIIKNKAFQMGDLETYETAEALYLRKRDPGTYFPSYSEEEAREILQSLTPWTIDWGDQND